MQKSQEIETSPAVAQTADQRAVFEAWFTANDTDPRMKKRAVERDSKGQYVLMSAASAWNVWQAAHSVLCQLAEPDKQDAGRYRKLRRWMGSNVPEGWSKVEELGAVCAFQGLAAMDLVLDSLPECNVGLVATAANAAPAQPGTTSSGWKLVPIEPTEDMIVWGFESAPDEHFSPEDEWAKYQAMSGCQQAAHRARLCWDAMLKHAPKPPVANGGAE